MFFHCNKKRLMVLMLTWFTSAVLADISEANLKQLDVNFNDKIPGSFLFKNSAEVVEKTEFSRNTNIRPFTLDKISAATLGTLPLVLDANFEDKALGQTIGTGGATVGEPVHISNGLITEVIDNGVNNQSLLLINTNGNALILKWELLDDIIFTSGIVEFELDVEFDALDQYSISFVNILSSNTPFTLVHFAATGSIGITDNNGFAGFVGTYQAKELYRLRLIYDMNAGLYDVLLDETILLEDYPHDFNTGNGITEINTGFQSSALVNSSFVIDNLKVRGNLATPDDVFNNSFE